MRPPNPIFPPSTRVPQSWDNAADDDEQNSPQNITGITGETQADAPQPTLPNPILPRKKKPDASFLSSILPLSSPYSAESAALDKQESLEKYKADYAELQRQKQERAAQKQQQDVTDAALENAYRNEGRPYFKDATGAVVPSHTDEQWAEERRQKLLSDQITAKQDEKNNPDLRPLNDGQRSKLERDAQKTTESARSTVQGLLDARSRSTTGGILGFGTSPTDEAKKAKERLDQWTTNPTKDLDEEDLNLLAGSSDPAHQQLAKDLTEKRAALQADDERAAQRDAKDREAWDLKMRRDNPVQWMEQQMQRMNGMPADALNARIDASQQDLQQRQQALHQKEDTLNQAHQRFVQQRDQNEQDNDAAIARGVPASQLVTDTNGRAWTQQHIQQAQQIAHSWQAWHNSTAGQRDDLTLAQHMLEQDAALHEHALNLLQQHQQKAEQDAQAAAAQHVKEEHLNQLGKDFYQQERAREKELKSATADAEARATSPAGGHAVDLGSLWGKEPGWGQKIKDSILNPLNEKHRTEREAWLKEHGVTESDVKPYVEDARKLDFEEGKPSAVLHDGRLAVNPALWFDTAAYTKAVDASDASAEAKQDALASQPALQRQTAATLYKEVAKHPDLKALVDASPGTTPEEKFIHYAETANKGNLNWLRQIGLKLTAGADTAVSDMIGLRDFYLQQPPSETAKYWQGRGQAAEAMSGSLPTNPVAMTAARIIGGIPSMLPAMAVGTGLGGLAKTEELAHFLSSTANAGVFGAQSVGGTYLHAAQKARQDLEKEVTAGKITPQEADQQASKAAIVPAVADGLITTVLFSKLGDKGLAQIFKEPKLTENVLKQAIGEKLKDYGYHAAVDATKFGLQSLAQSIVALHSYDPEKKPADILKEALTAAGDGAIFGLWGAYQHRDAVATRQTAEREALNHAATREILAYAPEGEDPATIQADKQIAHALREVGQGNIAKLTDDQLLTIGVVRDASGTLSNDKLVKDPRVKIENGQPLITQTALDRLEQHFPAVRATIANDEAAQRTAIAAQIEKAKSKAKPAAPEGTGISDKSDNSDNPPSADQTQTQNQPPKADAATAYHRTLKPEEAKHLALMSTYLQDRGVPAGPATKFAEDSVRRHSTSDDYRLQADEALRSMTQMGGGKPNIPTFAERAERALDEQVTLKFGKPGKAETSSEKREASPTSLVDHPDYAQRKREALQGIVDATEPEKRPERLRMAAKVLEVLDRQLERYGRLFPGGIHLAEPKGKEMSSHGGLHADANDGQTRLVVDLPEFVRNYAAADQPFSKDKVNAIRAVVEEEVIHLVALREFKPTEITQLWKDLPEDVQQAVWASYHAATIADKKTPGRVPADADAFQMGHEFLRQLVQDRAFRGRVTEMLDPHPALGQRVLAFLRRYIDGLRNLIRHAHPATRDRIAAYEERATTALRDLMATLKESETKPQERSPQNDEKRPPERSFRVTQKDVDANVDRIVDATSDHSLLAEVKRHRIYLPPAKERGAEWNWLHEIEDKAAGTKANHPLMNWLKRHVLTDDASALSLDEAATQVESAMRGVGEQDHLASNAEGTLTGEQLGHHILAEWHALQDLREQGRAHERNMAEQEQQAYDFGRDVLHPSAKGHPLPVQELYKGDVVMVGEHELAVTHVELDDNGHVLNVTLQDGTKYGRQVVDGQDTLYVEAHQPRPAPAKAEEEDDLDMSPPKPGTLGSAKKTPESSGHAQPLTAKVQTPDGWRAIGQLRVGDMVTAADGQPVRVQGVFPQGEQQVYKITLADGRQTRVTADHLWFTRHSHGWEGVEETKAVERLVRNHFTVMVPVMPP